MPKKIIESICLALPAYNEAAVIAELITQASVVLAETGIEWSIVVVDDGSKDQTAAIVNEVAACNSHVRLVQHEKNKGLGPAIITCLQSGLRAAAGRDLDRHLIVCMDADLTHPPQTIPSMRKEAEDGADLVIASRFQPGSETHGVPFNRLLMSWGARQLFKFYLNLPGVRDYTCGFRAFRGSLLKEGFDHFGVQGLITRSGFACTDELLVHLAMLGPVIKEVPFILRYDLKIGESKMNLGVTILETLKLLSSHRRLLRENQQRKSAN